jgi:hypothetical protein
MNKGVASNVINLRRKILNYLALRRVPDCPLPSGLSGSSRIYRIFVSALLQSDSPLGSGQPDAVFENQQRTLTLMTLVWQG